ncbi:Inosine/uridine-preferring nucleoside hydrolase domain-containing protein [Lentinula aciculospora]|uniref:Inosine/uridine-preferring nucleoside hydrolase domain-containing protein n=1 Tax=Lentinula aciculospora TaxID=153920 RepID=A0A9W9DGQ3_9AGAR|nr:Inosine/uridine-preferring nucleoside hydrolase domain-containing protein [Lentinula aciculospora]
MAPSNLKKIPVIFDTDPGVDDIIALLLALSSPELEVLAIIVSHGNTDVESSYTNVLKTYQVIQRHLNLHPGDAARFPTFFKTLKTIVCRGSQGPLQGASHSASYFHGRDGLGGINENHPEFDVTSNPEQLQYTDKAGIDVALKLFKEHEARSITYIAVGPLTNLAQMMCKDSELVSTKVGRVICMGGAIDVPGNTTAVAEFNFYADPFAARDLLGPNSPYDFPLPLDRFLLLPLDITTPHQLPFPLYQEFIDPCFGSSQASLKPLTHFTSSFLTHTRRVMNEFGQDAMELHDIVAVWCAIHFPPFSNDSYIEETTVPGWKSIKRLFDVECTGELTRGMVVVDRREDKTAYAPGANRAEVQAQLEKKHLFGGKNSESIALPAPVEIEPKKPESDHRSVWCVMETPGPEALLRTLLARVWGVTERSED